MAPSLRAEASATLQKWTQKLREAVAHCILDLDEATIARKLLKGEPKSLDQWKEAGPVLVRYLHSQAEKLGGGGIVATQMSNVQGLDMSQFPLLQPIDATRSLQAVLSGHPRQIEQFLVESVAKHVITWSPDDAGQAQKISLAFRDTAGRCGSLETLFLLIPMGRTPGCKTATEILDLWTHPLLSAKWADVVKEVEFLTPPAAMVLSGMHAPVHTQRPLVLVTLQVNGERKEPTTIQWMPSYYEESKNEALVIDLPEGHRWKAHRLLKDFSIPGVCYIEAPVPSAGHSKADPRSSIRIHFEGNGITTFDKELIRRWVQSQLAPFHALIGWSSMVNDEYTMLLDVSQAKAGFQYAELCSGMLVVKPKLVLVATTAEDETWKASLTSSWKNDPTCTGEKIRHRPSRKIGTVFAQVQATAAQISNAKARKGHEAVEPRADQPKTLQATIHIPTAITGNFDNWLPKMMSKISTSGSIPLSKTTLENGLGFGEWRTLHDVEGRWMQCVLVQLTNGQELRHLHRLLQGARIAINGHEAALEVSSPLVLLDAGGRHN